jgi:hypothetical protein
VSARTALAVTAHAPLSESSQRTVPAPQQDHELGARPWIIDEASAYARSHRVAVLLLNTAHHHAEVTRLDHDGNAERSECVLERLGDLHGESFLDRTCRCRSWAPSALMRDLCSASWTLGQLGFTVR